MATTPIEVRLGYCNGLPISRMSFAYIAGMARMMGADGIGPVTKGAALLPALEKGLADARAGKVVVIDARVLPGYDRGA